MRRPAVTAEAVDAFAGYLADVWGARPLAAESDLDPVLLRALRGDRLRFEREAESGGEDPVWREAIRRRYDRPIPEGAGAVAAALEAGGWRDLIAVDLSRVWVEVLTLGVWADALLGVLPAGDVLSCGCNAGYLEAWLSARHPDRRFVGVDLAEGAISAGCERMAATGARDLDLRVSAYADLAGTGERYGVVLVLSGLLEQFRAGDDETAEGIAQIAAALAPKGALVLAEARLAERAGAAARALAASSLGIVDCAILGGRGSRPLRHLVERQPMGAWRPLTGLVARAGADGSLAVADACRRAATAWDGPFTAFAEEQAEWTDRNLARAWAADAVAPLL
ncbi:MAG: SAM-dependent methyltransferase [Gaiellales bacterium]